MLDKPSSSTNLEAVADLDRQYAEHKVRFDQWRLANENISGTLAYTKYVEEFRRWELDIQSRRATLIAQNTVKSTVEKVDEKLEAIMQQVNPMQFMMAMMSVAATNGSLFPNGSSPDSLVDEQVRSCAFTSTVGFPAYSQTVREDRARELAIRRQRSSLPTQKKNTSPDIEQLGPHYGYAGRPDIFDRQEQEFWEEPGERRKRAFDALPPGTRLPAGWVTEPPIRRVKRAPSPLRDYRNPSTLPFRDFSQS